MTVRKKSTKVYKGSAKTSNAVVKFNYDNYFKETLTPNYNAAPDPWAQGTELIYSKARDIHDNFASKLVETKYEGTYHPKYESGYGVWGFFYKVAVQYASSNPYTYACINVNWEP